MATKEEMKNEAISRMKKLALPDEFISDFEYGNLRASHRKLPSYIISEKEKKLIDSFEKKYNTLVYHVIVTPTKSGTMFDMLYVGSKENEWEYANTDLDVLNPVVMCENLNYPDLSELGNIKIKSESGKIIRILYEE